MTDLISELKALSEKATPGPFIVSTCASPEESKGEVTLDALRSGGMGEVVYRYKWIKNRADCDLDAALRNHLPTILAKLEEAERERDEARAALAQARADALEEAKSACLDLTGSDATPTLRPGARMCVRRIDHLKDQTP